MTAVGRREVRRQHLAYESARMMAEQGLDAERARRKAARRLGVSDRRCWPDHAEIEVALQRQYRLFHAAERRAVTTALRIQALAAMQTFAAFAPRLVGAPVSGTTRRERGLELRLFADDPAEVVFALIDRGIPWQEGETALRYADGKIQSHPVFSFIAGEVPVELVVLPVRAQRNPPLSTVSERPDPGLGQRDLEQLLSLPEDPAPD
ncbi:MAG: hypothetical protein EA400_12525 [Chromatiaceae bacterium]|nr:MAG: hypothetical protein EA400_12525 [Chromatiaceae bacterium]